MIRAVIGAAALSLAFAATPASAQSNTRGALDLIAKGDRDAILVVTAIEHGFGWANTDLKSRKQPQLYCAPMKIALTAEQTADILKRFVKANPVAAEFPVGFALLQAMQDAFPCPPK